MTRPFWQLTQACQTTHLFIYSHFTNTSSQTNLFLSIVLSLSNQTSMLSSQHLLVIMCKPNSPNFCIKCLLLLSADWVHSNEILLRLSWYSTHNETSWKRDGPVSGSMEVEKHSYLYHAPKSQPTSPDHHIGKNVLSFPRRDGEHIAYAWSPY